MSAKIKEAPRSIWAKIVNGALFATWTDPREVQDSTAGLPVLRYVLVGDADTAEVDMKDAARELRTCVVEWAKAGAGSTERPAISDRFEAALSKYAAAARAPLAAELENPRLVPRMTELLNSIALTLKGPPGEDRQHGWADLPERVTAIVEAFKPFAAIPCVLKAHHAPADCGGCASCRARKVFG